MNKCQRILLVRWLILVFSVTEIMIVTFWWTNGDRSTVPGRVLDPVFLVATIAAITSLYYRYLVPLRLESKDINEVGAVLMGAVLGTGGTIIGLSFGVIGVAVGSTICVLLVLVIGMASGTRERTWKRAKMLSIVSISATTVALPWWVLTAGTVPAVKYSLTMIMVALAVHTAAIASWMTVKTALKAVGWFFKEPLYNFFCVCPD